jgi:hypothetical protein
VTVVFVTVVFVPMLVVLVAVTAPAAHPASIAQ